MPVTYILPVKVFRVPANGEYGNFAAFRVRRHTGTDASVPVGTPAYATVSGTVVAVGYNSTLGNFVIWWGDDGLFWSYSHLEHAAYVSIGQRISTGQHIADTGETGDVTGPHLHVAVGRSILIGVLTVDPMAYLAGAAAPGYLILAGLIGTPTKEQEDMSAPIQIIKDLGPENKGRIGVIGGKSGFTHILDPRRVTSLLTGIGQTELQHVRGVNSAQFDDIAAELTR
jgi:hypothetical protein